MKRKLMVAAILMLVLVIGMGIPYSFGATGNTSKTGIYDSANTLVKGPEINAKMKYLSGTLTSEPASWYNDSLYSSSSAYYKTDTRITAFKRSSTKPSSTNMKDVNKISCAGASAVYMWYENGTIYWWSQDSHPKLNIDSRAIFMNLRGLKDISGVEDFDTGKAEDFEAMFMHTIWLADYSPVANWDVSNVTDMQRLLYREYESYSGFDNNDDSYKLVDLTPFSRWDVSNVQYMNNMLMGNQYLTDLTPLRNWNTGNVVNFSYTFNHLHALKTLAGLEKWDVSSCTDMSDMFQHCRALTDISAVSRWNTSHVISMRGMWRSCGQLESIDALADWDTSNVQRMGGVNYSYGMFSNDGKLKDVSAVANWDVSKVTMMGCMFQNCLLLDSAESFSSWNTASLKETRYMFDNTNLTDLHGLENFNMSSVMDAAGMFTRADITNVDAIAGWNLSSMIDMSCMFQDCKSLTDISGLRNWKLSSNVTALNSLFYGASKLSDVSAIKSWDVSKVTSFSRTLKGTAVTSYPDWKKGSWNDGSYIPTADANKKDIVTLDSWNDSVNTRILTSVTTTSQGGNGSRTLTLKDGSYTLVPNTDYSISYLNNGKSGRVYMIVKGIGSRYRGTHILSFTLAFFQTSLDGCTVSKIPDQVYKGEKLTPPVTVSYYGTALTEGKDYFVSYMLNLKEGYGKAIITGCSAIDQQVGKYSGVKVVKFNLTRSIEGCEIEYDAPYYEYTGSAVNPVFELTYGESNVLKEGTDYTYTVKNNIEPGTATITITGKGSYFGTVTKTFEIRKKSVKNLSIALSYTSTTYTGSRLMPTVKITDPDAPSDAVLAKGTDYTLSYTNNVNAGTATVTVNGIGQYRGSVSKNFTIKARSITDWKASLSYTSCTYSGTKKTPTVTVTMANGAVPQKGVDYTVSYSKNVNAGTATVTITGTGNYKGTITRKFTIERKSIRKMNVTISDEVNEYTGEEVVPEIVVTDTDGTVLEEGTDYILSFSDNIEIGTATVTITGAGNYTGAIARTYEIR